MRSDNNRYIQRAAILLFIMIVGFFLALCAIFSLSYIKSNAEPKVLIVQRFDSVYSQMAEQLSALSDMPKKIEVLATDAAGQFGYINKFKSDPVLKDISRYNKKIVDRIVDSMVDFLSQHTQRLDDSRQSFIKQSDKLLQGLKNVVQRGSLEFKSQISKLSPGVLSKYSEDWSLYLLSYKGYVEIILKGNTSSLEARYRSFSNFADIAITNTRHLALISQDRDSLTNLDASSFFKFQSLPLSTMTFSLIDIDDETKFKEPKPGSLGSDWGGLLSIFISPLAGSNNVDILLIFGMIGFGLFGAGIAIFILHGDNKQDFLNASLLMVVVRGFSAAIIVFLAARCGIAVINSGNSDPNPLVLFLFCFIGAVFSERIWAWAKKRITDTFPEDQKAPAENKENEPS